MSYKTCCRGALLLLLVLGTVNSSAQTNHYRWVNAQGETVFSDRPPPAGIDYEVVSTISRQKRAVSANKGLLIDGLARLGNTCPMLIALRKLDIF